MGDHLSRRRSCALTSTVLVLLLAGVGDYGLAQSASAIVGQTVIAGSDQERYGASGVTVQLQSVTGDDLEGVEPPSSQTDNLGIFRFADIAEGCYIAVGESPGMRGQSEIFCLPGEETPLRIEFEMQVEVVVESLDVTAAAIEIDPTETSSSGSVGVSTLDNAPKANRSVEDVMPLIPGVLRGKAGEINMNGVRASQSGSQMNNVDVTDPVVRTSEIALPLSIVSSVEVLSTPYDAEYGGFAGAVSKVETRPADLDKFKLDLQNFTPRIRRRDNAIMGIESSTPRLTVNFPIKERRIAFLHATEYQFVRADQEDANLPVLERDVARESLTVFNQVDAIITDRNRATFNALIFPEKLSFFGLNAFNTQSSTPDLRRRGKLFSIRDTQEMIGGGLLLSTLSYQDLDSDVLPRSHDPSIIGLERATGGFFNRQGRNTIRRRLTEHYNFSPFDAAGRHQFKSGFAVGQESYSGDQTFNPVTWLGIGDRKVSELLYSSPSTVRGTRRDTAVFVQDKWNISEALTLDLGLRAERDSIAQDWNPSYRAGFAYALGGGSRTVLRGGVGLFIDRISLVVPTFLQLPERTENFFNIDGSLRESRQYNSRIDGKLQNAKSLGWNLQVDHKILEDLFLRVGYQQRRTKRNFLIDPLESATENFLTLSNTGRDQYREYQFTVRYRLGGTGHITSSYVHSSSVGDLNDLGSLYGPTPSALIRFNERAPVQFDVPNRLLTWTEFGIAGGVRAIPVWEVRSGFPYSNTDENRDFVGPRNRAGRFPIYNSIDLQVTKNLAFKYKGKERRFRTGIRLFNLLNTFNPQDFQSNLDSAAYGTFYRGVRRKIRAIFEVGY